MNPIVLSIADGTAFFVGLAVVLVAEILLFRFHGGLARPVLTVLAILGGIVVAISATPLPLWGYTIWGIAALVGLVLGNRSEPSLGSRCVACVVLVATTAGPCLAELPHRRMPHLTIGSDAIIYVLGDSISAGVGTKERCWPTMLEDLTRIRVVNLAEPGATVKSAAMQAKQIPGIIRWKFLNQRIAI